MEQNHLAITVLISTSQQLLKYWKMNYQAARKYKEKNCSKY